jgi:hypothetical protein
MAVLATYQLIAEHLNFFISGGHRQLAGLCAAPIKRPREGHSVLYAPSAAAAHQARPQAC